MGDCTSNPDYLISAAINAMSPKQAKSYVGELFIIAPNPFEQGRRNELNKMVRTWENHARRLIWC